MNFSKELKRGLFLLLLLIFSLSLFSCSGNTIEKAFNEFPVWETEADEGGSSIRWEFTKDTFTYYNVIHGEDTFSQTFSFTVNGDTLIAQSDYSTLTFDIKISDDTMTVKTESGKTLYFKGHNRK